MTTEDAARYLYGLVMDSAGCGEDDWPRTSEETKELIRADLAELLRRAALPEDPA